MEFNIGAKSPTPISETSHLGKKKKNSRFLTFEQVCEIRKLDNEGVPVNDLAKKFNKTFCTINNICKFRTHKYGR